jgi:hypothetical protein
MVLTNFSLVKLLFVFSLATQYCVLANIEVSINGTLVRTIESAALLYGPDLNNGTAAGYLTELNNDTICENSVVLLPYKIPLESKILFLQECGSQGIIVSSLGEPGRAMYLLDGTDMSDVRIPCHQVEEIDYHFLQELVASGEIVRITINPSSNIWHDVYESGDLLAARIVFLVIVGAAILVCLYRIVMLMVRTEHDEDVLAKVTLFFLIADFLGKLLYLALDPFGANRVLTYSGERILASLSFPFSLTSNFLIIFYWTVTLQKRIDINTGMYYMKAPAAFVVVTCFSLMVVLVSLPVENDFAFAVETGIYFFAQLPAAIFAIVTYIRLEMKMKKLPRLRARFTAADFLTAKILLASFCVNFLMVIPLALSINPEYLSPVRYLTAIFTSYGILIAVDMMQLFAIQIPAKITARHNK